MAEDAIGRADYVLGADVAGVKKGVAEAESAIKSSGQTIEAEYESRGYKAGVLLGKGILAGVKVLSAGASALFAIATKGSIELTNAQIEFQRETGASADEAARAGKAINAMSGRNVQSLGEIGATLAKVRTDLGLVGEEGERTTEVFLRYARVTKQDAVGAVSAFDDILDSWGLTAKDAQRVMDQLVVSHQKYGGAIEDDQRALAQLAPQMKALNLTIDDTIGLLNLFKSSGLDASVAQRALNSAIQNLPPGTNLNDFITQLSKIEDPALRAAKASEVFGSRAGPQLANAIKPGINGLGDFKVSAEEAAGATEKANDVLDSSFGGQIQRKIREVGAAIRGIGQDWGPAITGVGSFVSAIAAIGGDEVFKKVASAVGKPIVEAFKAAGAKAGEALSDGVGTVLEGAGGTVLGNTIATRIENIFDPLKNTVLGRAARASAAKLAVVWGAALGAGSALVSVVTGALSSAFAAAPFAAPVRAAVLAASIQIGTIMGTGMATAIVAGLALALAAAAPELARIAQDAGKNVHNMIFQGPLQGIGDALSDVGAAWQDWRKNAPWPLGQKDAPDWAYLGGKTKDGLETALIDPVEALRWDRPAESVNHAMAKLGEDGARSLGEAIGRAAPSALSGVGPAVSQVVSSSIGAHVDWIRVARAQANRAGKAVAQGILDTRSEVDQAWQDLLDGIKNGKSTTERTAELIGRLASKSLIKGLHDSDPAVRAQARYTKQITLDELEQLKPRAGTISKEAMKKLRAAMDSSDPDIRAAARRIYAAVKNPINPAIENAKHWGSAVGSGIAAGLNAWYYRIGQIAGNIASVIALYLQTHSPAKLGPLSHDGGPEGFGRNIGRGVAKGLAATVPDVARILDRSLAFASGPRPFLVDLVGQSAPAAVAHRAAAAAGSHVREGDIHIGGVTVHGVGSDVSPAAARRFGSMVSDEIANNLRRQGRRVGVHPGAF